MLLPEIDGLDLAGPDLAFFSHRFVLGVALLEGLAVEVVEIGAFVGAKKSPLLASFHTLHEEVGNPVRGVHVVRAATFVTGIYAELEKVLDVIVPGLEVGAAGAAPLATLVDGDELVVVELEERNDALGFAIGALNVASGSANGGPGSSESPGPLAEEGVLGNAAMHDGLDGVIDLVEVAARELGVEGAGVEERRGGGAEAAAFVEIVEADDPVFGVRFLGLEKSHRDAHPEELGRFHAAGLVAGLVDVEVAIVEGLDAEEIEVEVGGGIEGIGEAVEVVFLENVRRDALDLDAVLEVGFEVFLVSLLERLDAVVLNIPRQDLLVDVREKNAAGELGHVGILFEEGLGVENDGLLEVAGGDLGADGAAEFLFDILFGNGELESDHGELDALLELGTIPEIGSAIFGGDGDERLLRGVFRLRGIFLAMAGTLFTVADVVTRNIEEAPDA